MTQRTKAELDVLFLDNTSKLIVPSRARDLIDSITPSRGALHFLDTATPTVIVTQGAWVKASNVGVLLNNHRMSMPSDGRLQYDGTTTVSAQITLTLGMSLVSGSGDVAAAAIAINGNLLLPSIIRTRLGATSDVQAICLIVDSPLSPGDFIELYVANDSSTADLLVEHGYMSVLGFLS